MPAFALIPLLLTWGQGGLPTKAGDFLGTFAKFDDLVSTTLMIKPKGIAEKSWRPDTAGDQDWTGTWKLEGGVLKMRLVSKTDKRVSQHEFIPIRWGDRLSLVPRDQLEDYARRELEDMPSVESGRYGRGDWFSRFAYARINDSFRPGNRYGRPIAPKKYQAFFKDLVFKGYKDPGESIRVPVGSQESWAEMDARAPKVPITSVEMEEMIRIYRAYGLPLPQRSAKPYRVHQHFRDSPNAHEMDALVFVDESKSGKGRCVYWGTRLLTLEELRHPRFSQDPVVEAVKLTDPWVLTPRRFIGKVGHEIDYVTLWALTIQLSAMGSRDIAARMHPNWYNEFSTHSSFGWNPKWATPRACVDTIASDFAREEWCRPDGDRLQAAQIVGRVAKSGVAMANLETLKDEAEGMVLALKPGKARAGTTEALIDGLVTAPRAEGTILDAEPVKRLLKAGPTALPTLRAHLDDKRVTRLRAGGIQGETFNASVGYIC
ncbi:MAG: hypothetical protein ABL994_16460, partial [Verrucomicrobiales bacterium]